MNKFIIFHAKIFQPKFYFTKRFQILLKFSGNKKHYEIKSLKFFLESDNFLLYIIFGQSSDVGVNFVTSVSASVEAHIEVRCGLHCVDIQRRPQQILNNCETDLKPFLAVSSSQCAKLLDNPSYFIVYARIQFLSKMTCYIITISNYFGHCLLNWHCVQI